MGTLDLEPRRAVSPGLTKRRGLAQGTGFGAHHPLSGQVLSLALLLLVPVATVSPAMASPNNEPKLPTRLAEAAVAASDRLLGGANVMERYGNWLGPGWWGGSELDSRPGMLAPVDDLDATARKHDFGYQLAEQLGRGRPGVEASYKLLADIIAIRETKALDPDPSKWAHPPKDIALARTFQLRLIISFEEWQTRYNRFKSMKLGRDDIADLETLNNVLDGLPDLAKFEAMQQDRIRDWEKQYAQLQARKRVAAAPPTAPKAAPVAPSSHSLILELPGYWGHLSYTISGAQLDPPTGGDRGNVAGRSYTGKLSGNLLTVSGTGISDNESSGPGSGDYYILQATVSAGGNTKSFDYAAAKGEKLNRPFSVSVPVTEKTTSASFSIRLLEINANYGDHGWVVSGSLSVSPAGAMPNLATTDKSCGTGAARQPGKAGTIWMKDAQNRITGSVTYDAQGAVVGGSEARHDADGKLLSRGTYRCVNGIKQEYNESEALR